MSAALNLGKPQCYSVEEISTQMNSHEELDLLANMGNLLTTLLQDALDIRERMAECEEKTCLATLQTCINTNSLIRTDKLASYIKEAKKNINYKADIKLPLLLPK